MSAALYADHLHQRSGEGRRPERACSAVAGGPDCGNTLTFYVQVTGDTVTDAGWSVDGCEALAVAASWATDELVGERVLDAAHLNAAQVIGELGLTAKAHVAPLVEDAVHIALGRAAYEHAAAQTAERPRTFVAMSGGVDSGAAAHLTARAGDVEAVGVTLELWRDAENDAESSCCSASAVRAARAQAHSLGLAHLTLDLRGEFAAGVVAPYLATTEAGQTPNPCVACNGDVRVDAMVELADRLGGQRLVTGHYARLTDDGDGPLLCAAADPAKDQTYMLARLRPDTLAKLSFPLGEMTKPQVRALASEAGLAAANTPDSQDLCFLAGTDKARFLARHGRSLPAAGDIVDQDGNVLGAHEGVQLFTVGQRRGLGIGGGTPLYVIELRGAERQVVVGPKEALAAAQVPLRAVRLLRPSGRVTHIRLRYHQQAVACELPAADEGTHSRLTATLSELSEAAVPGQSACLLDGDLVVGQATIGR